MIQLRQTMKQGKNWNKKRLDIHTSVLVTLQMSGGYLGGRNEDKYVQKDGMKFVMFGLVSNVELRS